MQRTVPESKAPFLIAAFGAVAVTVALLFLFRFPSPAVSLAITADSAKPKATVRMARPDESNPLLKEEAELRDMRPLFLPTERNAALPEPRLEAGRTFLDNETLKLTFTDTEAQVSRDLPPITLLAGRRVEEANALDALSPTENAVDLVGFGRRDPKFVAVNVRAAYVEVFSLKDGGTILSQELPANARPPGEKSWSPLEMMATVDEAGLVGPLVVIEGSRVDETDVHFRNYLARSFRIGERLSPGFYRITVSP